MRLDLRSKFHLVQSKRFSARPRLGIKVRLLSDTDDTVPLAQVVSIVISECYIAERYAYTYQIKTYVAVWNVALLSQIATSFCFQRYRTLNVSKQK
jgi:hypothetical protein